MVVSSSRVERKLPRRICFSVKAANQRSTRFSQLAEVGVKCRWKRGRLSSQRWMGGRLVGAVVVQDQVHIHVGGHVGFDGVEELAKFGAAVPAVQFSDHLAGLGIEGGKQGRGAVAHIVVSATFGLSGAHRQQGSSALQGLDLALFIDTQYQRAIGRVQVEADDIAHLVDEQRIAAQFKGLACGAAGGRRRARCG